MDYSTAEVWYRKSLAIWEEQDNMRGREITYLQLGSLALRQENYSLSVNLFVRGANYFSQENDAHTFSIAAKNFHRLLKQVKQNAPEQEQQIIAHWDKTVSIPWATIEEQQEKTR